MGQGSPNWAKFRAGFSPSDVTKRVVAAYLSADRRVLGLFRICFGLVLLYDLARRVPEAARLYSDEGVLSGHFLQSHPQASPQFSLLFACSSAFEVRLAFALIGVVYAAYCLGFCTRVAQLAALICCTSLNSRNLFFEDGGTCTTILLAAWTSFLPLSDRYSLDALLRDARASTIRARVRGRAARQRPFVSLAVLAILLQACTIYYFNAAHQTGWTWRHGDAVHLVLWQHRVNTPLAFWLAQHEPSWFSPVSTWLVIRVERLIPLLLLFPVHRLYTRGAAFLAAVALHGGIALMMTLGPFSYAMMALMLLCVPGEAIAALGGKIPLMWRYRAARLRALLVTRLARHARKPATPREPAGAFRGLMGLREALVLLLIVASAVQVRVDNPPANATRRVEQPRLFRALLMYPRMQQYWAMFAPDAPSDDGTVVVDAKTASGAHIDPFTGAAPDLELARRGLTPHPVILSDYLVAMSYGGNRQYDPELKRYLKNWQQSDGRSSGDRLVSFSAWWVSHPSPKRGEVVPGPAVRRLLVRGKL